MTAKIRATLLTDDSTNVNDNTTGDISAQDVRDRITDLADSMFNPLTDALSLGAAWSGYLVASVAASALTIAVKTANGNDASATEPIPFAFRSPTIATGSPVIRTLTAALSLVISSGSTMGFANATAGRLWIVLFDDGGTLRLGAVNVRSGVNIMALRENLLLSSTAEGGAGAADSAQVIYTGTAVTTKALRILGYMDWTAGLTTAGTWAIVPTTIQLFGRGVSLPGTPTGNSVRLDDGAVASGGVTIPDDDTIPQNTEGTQFQSQAFTATSTANIISINAQEVVSGAVGAKELLYALFQNGIANALKVSGLMIPVSGDGYSMTAVLSHKMLAATVSTITFTTRTGDNSGSTLTFNGAGAARRYGGVGNSFVEIQEIMG